MHPTRYFMRATFVRRDKRRAEPPDGIGYYFLACWVSDATESPLGACLSFDTRRHNHPAIPRTPRPTALPTIRRPLREPGCIIWRYASTSGRSGAGRADCVSRPFERGTQRVRKAKTSDAHVGHRSWSCTSSQSRHKRATPSFMHPSVTRAHDQEADPWRRPRPSTIRQSGSA
jgi:hypothetical protein